MAQDKVVDDPKAADKPSAKPAKGKPRATMTIKGGDKVYSEGDDVTDLGEAEIARLTVSGAVRVE